MVGAPKIRQSVKALGLQNQNASSTVATTVTRDLGGFILELID